MMGWIWNGSQMIAADGVSFADRGFRWGMSVFETLRVAGGRTQFVDEHLISLESAATRCRMGLDSKAWDAARGRLMDPPIIDGIARIYLSAGEGGVRSPIGIPRVFLFFEVTGEAAPGIKRITVKTAPPIPVFSGLKTGNYWLQVHWLQEALAEGFDETILLNPDGTVRSACMGNLFFKLANQWVTPDAISGARMGVVRTWLVSNQAISERPVTVLDVNTATSILITNSNLGVHPVPRVGYRTLEICPDAANWQKSFLQAGF